MIEELKKLRKEEVQLAILDQVPRLEVVETNDDEKRGVVVIEL